MLMTQRQMLHSQNLRFPNPERLPKVGIDPLFSIVQYKYEIVLFFAALTKQAPAVDVRANKIKPKFVSLVDFVIPFPIISLFVSTFDNAATGITETMLFL
ncbi:unnamed protein product [Linum tenue]|uniref:Uncharacterized protein n=1 Tax=Linum tenue TaxID=586396 RepID=A0AAV0H5D6_9ROSI|nr:unnamed protein product [Linum tenue]